VVLILPAGVTNPKKVTAESARAFAVIVPNVQGLDTDWRKYSVPAKDVEKLTGYSFFGALPAGVARELKARQDVRAKPAKEPGTLPAFRKGCVIGNKTSKIFHVPGGRNYDDLKKSTNVVFFKDADAAKKAGYRQAKR
jgi:hypothetical protein